MKIGIIIAAFSPSTVYGGPVSVAMGHARGLRAKGHDVTILTSDLLELSPESHVQAEITEHQGIPVRYFKSSWLRPRLPFVRSPALLLWLKQNHRHFDVFHIHFAREWIPLSAASFLQRHQRPVVLQPHGMLNRRDGVRAVIDRFVSRRLLRASSALFALQNVEADVLRAISPHARISIVPNGIEPTLSNAQPRSRPNSTPTVLFLARLHPRKRVLTFIEMALRLRTAGVTARFRIVGPDGGDLASARHAVSDRGLEQAVTFVGPVSPEEATREFVSADVYVLPSIDEPFPMTVLEALRAGVPTVVTTSCHIAPMLEEGEAAIVSEPSAEALADAVKAILDSISIPYEVRSRAATRAANTTYSQNNVLTLLEHEYERATDGAH